MLVYCYDGTFEGLLTSVFEAYERKEQPESILPPHALADLFAHTHEVITCANKSERVWNGVKKIGGILTCEHLYYTFLSQEEGFEIHFLRYCQYLFTCNRPVMKDLANADVLKVFQLSRKVGREAHRILMFLRFEQAADGTYFAPYAPKYDVIPLVTGHFRERFADQTWIIYDSLRNYGVMYDSKSDTIEKFTINAPPFDAETGKLQPDAEHPEEENWQILWRTYFKSMAITERKNLKLQRNFMPKRFWKYLTEKRI